MGVDELRPQGCLKAEGGWTSFVLKAASRLKGVGVDELRPQGCLKAEGVGVDELRPQGCLKAEGEGGRAWSSRLRQG